MQRLSVIALIIEMDEQRSLLKGIIMLVAISALIDIKDSVIPVISIYKYEWYTIDKEVVEK